MCTFLLCAIVSCSDDDEDNGKDPGEEVDDEEDGKDPEPDGKEISFSSVLIYYSDLELYGKSAALDPDESLSSATLTLKGVLPTEAETIIDAIPLTGSDGVYSFETDGKSDKGTSFKVTGEVKNDVLTLKLTDITIPDNPLRGKTFPMLPTSMEDGMEIVGENIVMTSSTGTQSLLFEWSVTNEGREEPMLLLGDVPLTTMINDIASRLLYLTVEDITFLPDGNIVANYAPLKADLLSIMSGQAQRAETTESPLNLCRYYVDGKTVHIVPELQNILRVVEMNNPGSTGNFDISTILQYIPAINTWLTDGVKFNLMDNKTADPFKVAMGYGMYCTYYFDCDYRLCLDQGEIKPILQMLPVLLPLFTGNLNLPDFDLSQVGISIDLSLEEIVNTLIERMSKLPTETFEAGILLKE